MSGVEGSVLLLVCVFLGFPNILMYVINRSVVHINVLPITLALIRPYHWYGIISRKWVMINTKYLSSDSFLISTYKYVLNIRTMLEGLERFWWACKLHFAL